jgi:hypothetical protein
MNKVLFMKKENDLVAVRDKMEDMIHTATSTEKKVMVGEAEVRRHALLTSSLGTKRTKRVALFPKLDAAKALLLDYKKIQSSGLNTISIT